MKKTAPTLLLAAACLVLGSTGGAVAGKLITGADVKNNSLTSADIKNLSLAGVDIKTDSVRGGKIMGNTLGGGKVRDDSLSGDDILESSLGQVPLALDAASAQTVGPDGVATTALQNGAVIGSKLGPVVYRSTAGVVAPGTTALRAVNCLAGEVALRGGMFWQDVTFTAANSRDLNTTYSQPSSNGWVTRGYNGTADTNVQLIAQVYCLQ